MKQIALQELAIVLAFKEIDPTIVTPEFLKYSQIVPSEWEVSGQPLRSLQGTQVTFQNGVAIIAQSQRISFAEIAVNKPTTSLEIPTAAQKLLDILPGLSYVGVGINCQGYIDFGSDRRQTRDFLYQNILAPGTWQQQGDAPLKAKIDLGYTFGDRYLNLNITEAMMQVAEDRSNSIVLFRGNFDYDIANTTAPAAQVQRIKQIIANWQRDLDLYREVVGRFTMADTVVSFPQ